MKNLTLLVVLLPLAALAQPITNPTNNPNLPDYRNPSQQRNTLNQQLQTQNRQQQQNLQTQINTNGQRVQQGQMQPLPSQNQPTPSGGLLNGNNSGSSGLLNTHPPVQSGNSPMPPDTVSPPVTPAPPGNGATP